MNFTTSPRQQHAKVLQTIAKVTQEAYYRRLTFKEADNWLYGYQHEVATGYPEALAAQRSWDCIYSARRAK